jgi:hypothetical protein
MITESNSSQNTSNDQLDQNHHQTLINCQPSILADMQSASPNIQVESSDNVQIESSDNVQIESSDNVQIESSDNLQSKYYAYNNNINSPICRQFVNQGKCRWQKKCHFYHPKIITPIIKKKTQRKLGCCYCGSLQRRFLNKRGHHIGDDIPTFFVVCSRTGRSMKLCM